MGQAECVSGRRLNTGQVQETSENTKSLEAEKKIQYKSLNIKIKAKQSTETKKIRAGMRISPISSFCQFAKGFAMTAVGGVPGLKTEKMHQAQRRPPWRKWILT